ncbi:hypothetical protein [Bacillus sp. LMB3902]|uniref:hypothetical protein n=1 Tax=Bacillus sp. LMB3902 TaxID=3139827 RepID=UPI003189A8BA
MNKENLLQSVKSIENMDTFESCYFLTLKEMLFSAIEENKKEVLEMIIRKSYDADFCDIAEHALKIID